MSIAISMFLVTPVSAITASELNGKLQTLKSQYPNGTHQTKFYNSTYGGSACYRDLSGHSSWECMAWARKVYDFLWGDSVSKGQFHQNVANICVGDYVRYYAGSYDHSILVTNIIGDNIYYTDCNGAAINNVSSAEKIQWDRAPISKTDLQNKLGKKLNNSTSGWSYGHIVHYPNNNIKTLSATTPPKSIPQISSIKGNGSNVTVSWNAVSGAEKYTVDFWNPNGSHNYFSTTETSITQSLPNAQYGIRICAENAAGTSGFSNFYYIYVGEYPISFDANGGELERIKGRITYDSINGTRGEDQLVIYNNSGTSTGTNMYGIEVLINNSNQVIDIINRVGSATVPINGFVLSAHREKHYWLEENVSIGDYVNYHPNTQEVWIWSGNGWLTWTKMAEIGKEYGELPIPLNREGYAFDGWYTSATGGEKVTEATTVVATEEHTLYAHWIPIEAHTSTTINNNLFTIKCTNIENGNRVILALYKDKKFVKLYEDVYQGENIPFTVTEDYDEAKVIVWKDLNTLKPITDVEIVK